MVIGPPRIDFSLGQKVGSCFDYMDSQPFCFEESLLVFPNKDMIQDVSLGSSTGR